MNSTSLSAPEILTKTTKAQHILSLSTEEKRQFLSSFDYVFSDIDGVVWDLQTNVAGAADAFSALQSLGKKLTFITNNSVHPINKVLKKFQDLNLIIDEDDIIHPAKSIVDYLKSIKFDGLLYVIASDNFKKHIRDAGFNLIDGPNVIIEESFSALAQQIFDKQNVDAVIIDVDFNLSSMKIQRAHFYLRKPECLLISGATDTMLPVQKNLSIIGPGPFVKVLDDSTKQKMITLGKPSKHLADMLISKSKMQDPKRTLMIGDMLEQDVGFGKECGFQTMIVLSGGCNHEELLRQNKAHMIPDYYADSVADFIEFIVDLNKSNV